MVPLRSASKTLPMSTVKIELHSSVSLHLRPNLKMLIDELLAKGFIRKDRHILSIHRVVQEAINYHDVDDLQESFDIASRLVYEQFPKQDMSQSLFKEWSVCQDYIPHGVYLSKKYSDYAPSGNLKAH